MKPLRIKDLQKTLKMVNYINSVPHPAVPNGGFNL